MVYVAADAVIRLHNQHNIGTYGRNLPFSVFRFNKRTKKLGMQMATLQKHILQIHHQECIDVLRISLEITTSPMIRQSEKFSGYWSRSLWYVLIVSEEHFIFPKPRKFYQNHVNSGREMLALWLPSIFLRFIFLPRDENLRYSSVAFE